MESRPRVLVVDDDEELRKLLCEQLARAAYTVHGVCDGLEALMELEDRQWDVVLTDCKMPYLSGLDLLGVITACWPDTPVVMISGGPPDTANLALKQGAFAWIQKPYDPVHLTQVVHAAIKHGFELRAKTAHGLKRG